MATNIKKTSVSGRVPNTFTLSADGDIGINTHDGKLWVSNGSVVFEIGAGGGGSGVPGGLDTQIQFNDSNQFAGDAGLTYNKTTDALTLAGLLYVGANVIANTSALFVGNSSVNSAITSSSASLGNTTINGFANVSSTLAAGNTTINGFANVSSTLAAGNTTITGFANVSSTLAAGNTTITGFANVSSTLQVGANVILGTTTIQANGSVGTIGQILTSGASGNVYWGPINTETTIVDSNTARTLSPSDANKVIEFTNGSDIAITIANNQTQAIPVESTIYMIQGSVGQVVITPGSGVTIDYSDSLKSRTRESLIGLKQIQLDKWMLFGDTEPVAPALSVLARATNSSGRPSFLSSGGDGRFLKQNSSELVFAALSASDVSAAITSGTATLVAGSVTVSSSLVASTTKIFLTVQSLGTVTTPKTVSVTSRVNSTSFTIRSEDNTDTSVVAWMMIQ